MRPSPPATIDVRNLAKRYGSVEAISDLSFELLPGEIFGLLGENGAGKTTTLECLLGLRQPDAGQIKINGINLQGAPAQTRQCLGALLQSAALQDKITPHEALQLFASFYPKPANTGHLLAQLGLSAKARAPFDSLSGGQKQRLFLALALVNNPEILVLDEPTAGLDPQARRELHRIILRLKSDGRTILLSTHNLEEAGTLCDRIGILHQGRMIACDTPAALIARSRSTPRVSFRIGKPLSAANVAALPGVVSYSLHGNSWQVTTADTNQTRSRLIHELQATGNELLDLQIQRPTLEDAFIELTGRARAEPEASDQP